ncbi:phosphatidylinositol mannoside acyltransferase [Trujillonella endophytica]|uniref:KDO2-lipid IV(A) lauroyltransferase n=1 Tax=Trujillonella endophytica TaxID=673521 RepID=A0A1H8TYG0_9ACTN|nr:phosphatidylinositol mannoside acyltransferase [Trujillella endophytica]SEO96060.1 KDO2-lipid IV(A) lauroyltransferase [Trujillella endophytica]
MSTPVADRPASAGLRTRALARATDLGYAAGWGAVTALPEPLARSGFDTAFRWVARRDGGGVRQLRANLRAVTGGTVDEGELDALTVRAMRSYGRYWQEAFRLSRISPQRILRDTEVTGGEHLDRALASGRPVVAALPHSGNWDASAVWYVDRLGGPFLTVAERLRPESLYRRFLEFRESLGMRVVPLTGGPRPSATVLREWLDGGGSVALLCDRDLAGNGIPVSFAGRPTTMPGGPALVAAQTGAALLPMVCSFTERGWGLTWLPEIPVDGPGRLRDRVTAATQGIADAFATTIARRPEDWHVLGRIWPDVPPDPVRGAPPNRTGLERV